MGNIEIKSITANATPTATMSLTENGYTSNYAKIGGDWVLQSTMPIGTNGNYTTCNFNICRPMTPEEIVAHEKKMADLHDKLAKDK